MKIKNLTIELMVDDVHRSIEFYQKIFGFTTFVKVPDNNPFFVIMKNNSIQIMLYQRDKFVEEIPKFEKLKLGGSIVIYLEIAEVKNIFQEIKNHVKIIQKMHETDYGTSEFSFEDINGYVWMLSEKIKDF